MNGDFTAAAITMLFASNGIIFLIVKNMFTKKMKSMEYNYMKEADEREHRQKMEEVNKVSTTMLYEELEELRVKIIKQVQNEVKQAESNAEKQILIDLFKIQCPGCFASVEAELLKK
jgi:hypothetical protein